MKTQALVATFLSLVFAVQAFAASNGTAELNKAMRLAEQDKTKPARAIVDALLNDKKSGVPQDRLLMTKARLQYQDGDMKHALETYQEVPSNSDYWLESLEEKAWAYTRLGQYGDALASLKTLKAPLFEPLIGPEPYFLNGLIELKICDYPKIFDSINDFKQKFRPRLVAIQELSKSGTSQAARETVEKLRTQPLEWKTVAVNANLLPRLFHRDVEMARLVKALQSGNATSANVLARMQVLAQRDMKEIGLILQKMQLLEAEVIQRIHLADKPGRANRKSMIARNSDTLVFPDTDEYWMDELDKYHVNVSGCPGSDGGKKL